MTIITCDTNSVGGKKFCVLSHDEIEALVFDTPAKFRNFYELAVNSDSIQFPIKLYYDYDKKGEIYSAEKKQQIFQRIRDKKPALFFSTLWC